MEATQLERKPAPGSPAAHERGCICPEMENQMGKGVAHHHTDHVAQEVSPHFCINQDCPIHGFRQ